MREENIAVFFALSNAPTSSYDDLIQVFLATALSRLLHLMLCLELVFLAKLRQNMLLS